MKLGKNSYDFSSGSKKLRIQIRLSPKGKPKMKPVKKKRETGVAASRSDYPASTNVTSPIQAATKRRIRQTVKPAPNLNLQQYEYAADDSMDDYNDGPSRETEDEDSEEFEPVRVKGKTSRMRKRSLGPPITIDEKIASLNDNHQAVVENFLIIAKNESQKVSPDKSCGQFYSGLRNFSC